MINQFLQYSIGLLSLLSFGLGAFSILKNYRAKVVRIWFLLSIVVGVWSAGLLMVMMSNDELQGISYSKVIHVSASFIPILFFHFVVLFRPRLLRRYYLWIGYLLSILFAILSLGTKVVAGASPKLNFLTWVDAGPLYSIFLLYFWFYTLFSIYLVCIGIKDSDGILKKKMVYLLLGSLVLSIGGGSNFLPQTLGIYPYGDFIVWLYPMVITYGIFVD